MFDQRAPEWKLAVSAHGGPRLRRRDQSPRAAHAQLADGLAQLGLEFAVPAPYRLPMLNAVRVPAGVDEARVRLTLLQDHDIEIGAGLGPLAGKI